MSDALLQAIRARFAAALVEGRKLDAREAFWMVAGGPQAWTDETRRAAVAAAFEELEARLDALAASAAESVRSAAAVLVPDADDRAEVLDDPRTAEAAEPLDDVRLVGLLPASWPGDAAPDDVLDWIAERTGAHDATKKLRGRGSGVLVLVRLHGVAGLERVRLDRAAVLYSVERSLGKPDPRRRTRIEAVPLDVGGVSRRTYPALVGGVATGVEGDYTATEARLVFSDARTGHKGRKRLTSSTLALPHAAREVQLNFEDQIELTLSEVLAAVARSDYGVQAARFLLGVAALTALQRAAAGGSAVIYWEELAGLLGVKDDRDFRRRASETLGGLAGATIETRFPDRTFWADPLVTVAGFGSVGFSAVIAKALYRGVREESGRIGRHWASVPLEVLPHPRAALGAVILGSSFRASLSVEGGPVAQFRASRIADLLGVRPRGDRSLLGDTQARESLAEVYAVLAASGYIADAPALPDAGDPTLVSRPGAFLAAVLDGGKIERGAVLPATGEELGRYVELARARDGRTVKEVAAELGVGLRTLREALDRGAFPLSGSVRRALRAVHWGVKW